MTIIKTKNGALIAQPDRDQVKGGVRGDFRFVTASTCRV
ncbi:hypothetical protein ACVIHF_000701 [Bradyrhizobium sp. USDA 4506]